MRVRGHALGQPKVATDLSCTWWIQQYRSICLLNVSFKIFIKVATVRLNNVADRVVRPSQTAFMKGHNILNGVVILHETLHELHRKNLNGVILKIDFEKV